MYEFMYSMRRNKNDDLKIPLYTNFFISDDLHLIPSVELAWSCIMPSELVAFYREMGWGQLQTGSNGEHSDFNYIASLQELIDISRGTSDWLMPYSRIEPSTLPFFQRDVDLFLCLKPHSDNPNAVWWMWGEKMPNQGKICDSLVEFFERLVQDPDWFSHAPQ